MNYTENYHLPQWEETDRIMRTDFNAAMAGIEDGLNEANASAASALDASEAVALARLRRIGYDLCQMGARSIAAGAIKGTPFAKGLIYNSLTTDEERAGVNGIYLPSDAAGGWLGPQAGLSFYMMNKRAYEWQDGNATDTYRSATAWVKFRTEHKGIVTRLVVWMVHTLVVDAAPSFQVKLYDQDADTCVYTSDILKPGTVSKTPCYKDLNFSMPVDTGKNYRLELILQKDSLFLGTFGFGLNEGDRDLWGSITPIYPTEGTVTDHLHLESPAHTAIAVAHYGGSQAPTASIGGTAMTAPCSPRNGFSAAGKKCKEQEFILEGSWENDVSLTMAFHTTDTNVTIYDVECYFI